MSSLVKQIRQISLTAPLDHLSESVRNLHKNVKHI